MNQVVFQKTLVLFLSLATDVLCAVEINLSAFPSWDASVGKVIGVHPTSTQQDIGGTALILASFTACGAKLTDPILSSSILHYCSLIRLRSTVDPNSFSSCFYRCTYRLGLLLLCYDLVVSHLHIWMQLVSLLYDWVKWRHVISIALELTSFSFSDHLVKLVLIILKKHGWSHIIWLPLNCHSILRE